jgi:signal transduction histidine kinase
MVIPGRRKSIAFYIAFGVCLITVILVLYVGWVLRHWQTGILLVLGVLLVLIIIFGVVINTISIVREIRRNEQHDAFINAVTHELKTPVASIRLYLQTLQSRAVDETRRHEFYKIMLADSDRLLATIEQVLRTGRMGAASPKPNLARIDLGGLIEECLVRVRTMHALPADSLIFHPHAPAAILADADEVRAAILNLIDNAVKYSGSGVKVTVETEMLDGHVLVRVKDQGPGIPRPS